MRVVNKVGKCISCGKETKLILDDKHYVCMDCLDKVGKETNNVKQWIKNNNNLSNISDFICILKEFLYQCQTNNIDSISNCIKTLDAILIAIQFENNTLPKKDVKYIEKMLKDIDKLRK